jgi:hypothetical protein
MLKKLHSVALVADVRPVHAPEVTWDPAQRNVVWIAIHQVAIRMQHEAAFSPRANEARIEEVVI